MAGRRRASSRRSTRSTARTTDRRRKSLAESKIERTTWALLVGVFAVLTLIPDETVLPNWVAPLAGGLILLSSGLFQYTRGWRVAPVTWIGGSLMMVAAYYGIAMNPERDLLGVTLLTFAGVIAFGLVTGEG